jgi:hypothetical protein
MKAFVPVTDADLERARQEPAFRQQLLAKSLERLIGELNRLKSASTKIDAARLSAMVQSYRTWSLSSTAFLSLPFFRLLDSHKIAQLFV